MKDFNDFHKENHSNIFDTLKEQFGYGRYNSFGHFEDIDLTEKQLKYVLESFYTALDRYHDFLFSNFKIKPKKTK